MDALISFVDSYVWSCWTDIEGGQRPYIEAHPQHTFTPNFV